MDVREKAKNDKRLIDANKLIKNGIRVSYGFDNDGKLLIPMGDVIRSIKEAPTIDAVPVVHGRWEEMHYEGGILDGTNFDRCSVCGYERVFDDPALKTVFKYCPNCGAIMDGGAD